MADYNERQQPADGGWRGGSIGRVALSSLKAFWRYMIAPRDIQQREHALKAEQYGLEGPEMSDADGELPTALQRGPLTLEVLKHLVDIGAYSEGLPQGPDDPKA